VLLCTIPTKEQHWVFLTFHWKFVTFN